MQENQEKCTELANRIYDLDAEVYKCVGSALAEPLQAAGKTPYVI